MYIILYFKINFRFFHFHIFLFYFSLNTSCCISLNSSFFFHNFRSKLLFYTNIWTICTAVSESSKWFLSSWFTVRTTYRTRHVPGTAIVWCQWTPRGRYYVRLFATIWWISGKWNGCIYFVKLNLIEIMKNITLQLF